MKVRALVAGLAATGLIAGVTWWRKHPSACPYGQRCWVEAATLRELRRVLKPEGRLVVGELLGDPHMVRVKALRARAERAGLRFERRVGPAFGYFGVFRADG